MSLGTDDGNDVGKRCKRSFKAMSRGMDTEFLPFTCDIFSVRLHTTLTLQRADTKQRADLARSLANLTVRDLNVDEW